MSDLSVERQMIISIHPIHGECRFVRHSPFFFGSFPFFFDSFPFFFDSFPFFFKKVEKRWGFQINDVYLHLLQKVTI